MSFDIAELSALRWAIECITTSPEELRAKNRQLETIIGRQRRVIRNLVTYQHRIPLSDHELEALVDAATLSGHSAEPPVTE